VRARAAHKKAQAVKPSDQIELMYRAELRVMVKDLQRITARHIVPKVKSLLPRQVITDASPAKVKNIINAAKKMRKAAFAKQADALAQAAVYKTLGYVDEGLTRVIYNSVSVDITAFLARSPTIRKVVAEKTAANVDLITTIPEQYFDSIQEKLDDNWQAGFRYEDLIEQIQGINDVTEGRAKVIARDQTSKLNSAFNQTRQFEVGIDKYEWGSADDERTRPEHFALDGTVHSWAEPGPLKGTIDGEPCHPGEDVLCRCDGYPYIDFEALEAELEAV
jgi:SPP1 gp7 family putative phage head morphogenesis protein